MFQDHLPTTSYSSTSKGETPSTLLERTDFLLPPSGILALVLYHCGYTKELEFWNWDGDSYVELKSGERIATGILCQSNFMVWRMTPN